jgi:hypothetical protein
MVTALNAVGRYLKKSRPRVLSNHTRPSPFTELSEVKNYFN